MQFTNLPVALEELPAIEEVTFSPLEPAHLTVQKIVYWIWVCVALIVSAALFYFVESFQSIYILLPVLTGILVVAVLVWFAITADFSNSGYALREKDVLYRSGWLRRSIQVVPLSRVQHVSVQSGPIERRYDLASVSLYTAGAEQADLTIRGINSATALQVKNWITAQLHGSDTTQ